MGSYPALAIKPIQQESVIDTIAKMQQIKGMKQQQEENELDLQAKRQQLQYQNKITQAYITAGGDLEKTAELAAKSGVPLGMTFPIRQQAQAWKQQVAQTYQQQGAAFKTQVDMLGQQSQALLSLPPEQRPQALAQVLKQSVDAGALPPEQAQQIAQSAPVDDPVKLDTWLKVHAASAMSTKDQLDKIDAAAAQQRQAQLFPSQLKSAQAEATIKTAEASSATEGGVVGTGLDAQEARAWLKNNPGKDLADYQKYKATLVPQFNFNLQAGGLNAPQGATPTSPAEADQLYRSWGAKGGIIRGIVEGRQSPPSAFAQKTPYWQDVMQKVYQVDPNWNEQRAQVRKAFAVGPDAKNIGSLNTAAVHLDALGEAAIALDNGNFTPKNEVYQRVAKMFGGSAPTTFGGLKSAVVGEMANALKGNATDIEIRNISEDVSRQSSPRQLADWINANMHIIGQKLQTYKERYEQQNPGDTVWSPVLPSAQKVFEKHGQSAAPSQGGTQPIYAVNPQTKQRIVSNDGGQTWQPAQ